ncbi:DUF7619 domain-containing protein [Flavobacterium sp.]
MKKTLLLLSILLSITLQAQPPSVMPPFNLCDSNNDGFETFNLDSQIPSILNGMNPNTTVVSFHTTSTDAQNDANPITNTSAYTNINPNGQGIHIRVEDNANSQVYFSIIELIVNQMVDAGTSGTLTICDSSPTVINLFSIITGEQAGGTWTRVTGTGGTFDAAAGTFTSAIGATSSRFIYTMDGISCLDDTSAATITINSCYECGSTFTDPAGAGNYTNNMDYTVTISPSTPGDMVTVTFSQFNVEANWDALYVFNGNSVSAPQIASTNPAGNVPGGLAGGYWGTVLPGPFTSSSPDGSLTFRFRTDNTGVRTGWIASVTCAPRPACALPVVVSTTALTNNSVTLNWNQPTNADNSVANTWDIIAYPCGSAVPTASSIPTVNDLTSGSPYVLSGLLPSTCYSVCIRAVCSPTESTPWVCFTNFTTLPNPPVCGGQFVDSGGPAGNYTDGSDITTTICPTNPGDLVTVTFASFNVENNFDALYVFNGNSIAATQIASTNPAANVPGGLAGGFWGTALPGPFTSSSPNGCLTFRFRSDSSQVRAGWIANITCAPAPTCIMPNSLSATAVTNTTATLNWISPADDFQVLIVPSGSPAPLPTTQGIPVDTNEYLPTNLTPLTCYTFYVRAVCSENDSSTWAGGFNFCTMMTPPACGGQFTDNGGPSAMYTNNADVTTTICPTNPGEIVTVVFSSFETEATWDALYVFDGNSTAAPQISSGNTAANVPGGLAGGYWGTTIPGPFTSTSPDGCLTFRFRSDNSGIRNGWIAGISCAPDADKVVLVAYVDQNTNGVKDAAEPLFSNGSFVYQQNNNGVNIIGYSPTGQYSLYDSNASNTYSFSYQLQSAYAPYYSSGTTSYSNISIATGSGTQILYFPITLTQTYNDVSIVVSPVTAPRPGLTYINRITYRNSGVAATNGTITFSKPTQVTTMTVSQTGIVNNVSGFTYAFTNLLPNETRTFIVTMTVPAVPIVNINDLLTATASITAPTGDINLANNSNTNSQIVVASWDPNDKMESRGKTIPFNQFAQTDYFFYTIRFQNNGTANAIDVRIEDLLNAKIDETSVLMVSSSHNYTMQRINNQLVWNFKNIFLTPSSVNESASRGYVQFKVKLKPGFVAGDIIPNNASIYFDTNPAITTATFNSKFTIPLGIADFDGNSLVLYPNPASSTVQIDLVNTTEQISQIVFYDLLGKAVKTITTVATGSVTIDVSDLSRGVYLTEITSENNLKITKKLLLN